MIRRKSIESIIEHLHKKVPEKSKEELEYIWSYQFKYLKEQISSDKYPTVSLQHIGRWRIKMNLDRWNPIYSVKPQVSKRLEYEKELESNKQCLDRT